MEKDVRRIGEAYLAAHRTGSSVIALSAAGPSARPLEIATEELGDADLPASFSAVWGRGSDRSRRPAPAPRDPPAVTGPSLQRPLMVPIAAALLCMATGFALSGSPAGAAAAAIPHTAGAARVERSAPTIPSAAPAPVPAVRREPAGAWGGGDRGSAVPEMVPVATDFEPGRRLDVEGEVVSVAHGQAVLHAQGRYYMLRGPRVERFQVGRRERARGAVTGVSDTGIVYLELGDA